MADTGEERDFQPTDAVTATNSTNRVSESLATEEEGSNTKSFEEVASTPGESISEKKEVFDPFRPAQLRNVKSHRTTASGFFGTDSKAAGEEREKKWYRKMNPLKMGPVPPVPTERIISREATAPFWSLLTFQWMSSLMRVGYRRPLQLNDVWLVNPRRKVSPMTNKVEESFRRRVAAGDKYPLLWAMHDVLRSEFWVGGLCQLTAQIVTVLSPFTLRYLITFANEAYDARRGAGAVPPSIGRGVGLVLGVTAMQVVQSLGTNHFIFRGFMTGGQARAILIALVFEKSMRISGRAKAGGRATVEDGLADGGDWPGRAVGGEKSRMAHDRTDRREKGVAGDGTGWANGKVVNLMSVDTYRVDQAMGMFHLIWVAPIACVLTLVILVINISYSALAGFGLLVVGLPALTRAVKVLFVRRKKINKITDARVSVTQEILQAVRFVKYFGWELPFLQRIDAIRNKEIRSIQVLLAIRNAINAVSMSLPIFASMLSFVTYSLTDHNLDPAKVFSSLGLFNSLRMPLNLLPLVIGQVVDAWSSLNRIQDYLLCEEMGDAVTWDLEGEHAVKMKAASFTWERMITQDKSNQATRPRTKAEVKNEKRDVNPSEKGSPKEHEVTSDTSGQVSPDHASTLVEQREPFKLHDLSFTVGRNELVAVIGGVGSGKSSVLAALAGDMRRTSGEVVMGASRAFCPQYAWIQNATVRENVLFGKAIDREWYGKVIDACALQPDLAMLPNGDRTEIGERGITVSGGQKQRLNIARAIYFDADIILMDDPLSAVDAHVGRHIFDHAISGLLKDKCRILATHQLWVLNRCDRIIWMEEGRIRAIDTYEQLMASNEGFREMMHTTAAEEEQEAEATADREEVEGDQDVVKKGGRKGVALMQSEERAVKSVPWEVYIDYIKSGGSIFYAPGILLVLLLSQGANIATSLWLSYWTSDKFGFSEGTYIGVYAGLGASQAFLMFVFSISLTMLGTTASKVMLNKAITKVLRAPMSFFDTTPLGRITNRFSRDVDTMDNNLTDAIRMYFITLAMICSVFILIIAYFHYFAVALGPLFLVFLFAAAYYRSSAREIKRFESVLRSNVFAKFSEALAGVACIRAYGLQEHFQSALRAAIDEMDSAYFLTFSNQRWLSVRLDAIGNMLVFTTGILVVTSRFEVSPSIAGLVLSYILSIVQMIQFTVRQLAEVENGMNSTERLHYYGIYLDEEAPLHTVEVRPTWPEKGEISFNCVEMRYRENLPLVLRGFSMNVKAGERIGIVGRTGAGKSSIMSTLFRLVEVSAGSISIDGMDISTIGLHDLRSRLAIIPQDPTLFRGTIRSNLDPFSEHTDLELWSALRQADLISETATMDDQRPGRIHLDGVVEEEGLNFSLGQRQLMALARALVRQSRIIVCDEATSSVDMETDDKIQRSIRRGFAGKTLLCIAHRLRTILHYDRICVMHQGRIAEMDQPLALFDHPGGIFRGMCERSGIGRNDFESKHLEGKVEGV